MLHEDLKKIDKIVRQHEKHQEKIMSLEGKRSIADRQTKALKSALADLHKEVNSAESWFKHIKWLQGRFPKAKYDDVTGLCKLASLDEVKEQDYSLNSGRYVGVVIEEDGKTDDEFVAELQDMNNEFIRLNVEAHALEEVITSNIRQLVGDQ